MFGKIAFAALMVCLLGALAADAADCNYDLTNVGTQTPFDVAITIPGHHTFSDFWNNIGDGNPSVTYYTSPPPASIKSTTLHWVKRPVAPIVYGETIHVGFSLAGLRHCPPVHIK